MLRGQTEQFNITVAALWLIPLTLFCFWSFRSLSNAYSSDKRSIPGPFLAKFTRLWYLRQIYKGNWHETNLQLHKTYGPIVRIAPNEFSVDNPNDLKTIYGHGTQFKKSPWYHTASHPPAENIFSDQDIKRHSASRRKIASLYSMSTLVHMEPCVNECATLLMQRLEQLAQSQTVFNLQEWLQFFAFDTIGSITAANRFGFLDKGEDVKGLMKLLRTLNIYKTLMGVFSEYHTPIWRIHMFLVGGPTKFPLFEFMHTQVRKRREELKDVEQKPGIADDFLAKVLQKHADDPENFHEQDVFGVCGMNVAAGSDTTSISLCSVMWHLMKYPHTHEKLRSEIDSMLASGEISMPPSFKDTQKMVYLQAVIKEALRMHPATGLPLGRVVPKGGAEISGRHLPEGTVVGVNTWVAHYNQDVFGPDAHVFIPERWLQKDEQTQMMDRYNFPFGLGSRTCMGKNISLMEMSILIPQLVRKFDFDLVDCDAPLQAENFWFVQQKNVNCRVRVRSS